MVEFVVLLGALVTLVLSIAGMNGVLFEGLERLKDGWAGETIECRHPYCLRQPPGVLRRHYSTVPKALAISSKMSSSEGCVLSAACGEHCSLASEAAECAIIVPIPTSTDATSVDGLT